MTSPEQLMNNDSLHLPIYMDYSATTPVDPRVVDKMIPYLREQFGNPASRMAGTRSAQSKKRVRTSPRW
jgi:cysteine sulfinate desulfinase/cysteine desulfurase-like protein